MHNFPKAALGGACVIGEALKIGDGSSVKRSIIGKNCKIGPHAKIVNSVLMDHCTVEENVTIEGTILCTDSIVQKKSSLKDCRIGTSFTIAANTDAKNETLCNERDSAAQ